MYQDLYNLHTSVALESKVNLEAPVCIVEKQMKWLLLVIHNWLLQ